MQTEESQLQHPHKNENRVNQAENQYNSVNSLSESPIEEKHQNHRIFHACINLFMSGFFGSIASFIGKILFVLKMNSHEKGKHSFSKDFERWGPKLELITHGNTYLLFGIRMVLFIFTLYMNSFMLKFFINSLKRIGATVAKVVSLSVSFFMNGLVSYFYFGEPMALEWCIGLFLIMSGIYFLAKDRDYQIHEQVKKKPDEVAELVSKGEKSSDE